VFPRSAARESSLLTPLIFENLDTGMITSPLSLLRQDGLCSGLKLADRDNNTF